MSRITLRWNLIQSSAFSAEQKERLMANLSNKLTADGDLIIHKSESRSQLHNKELALTALERIISNGLKIPKKRKPTKASAGAKKERLEAKKQRGTTKKLRSKKFDAD